MNNKNKIEPISFTAGVIKTRPLPLKVIKNIKSYSRILVKYFGYKYVRMQLKNNIKKYSIINILLLFILFNSPAQASYKVLIYDDVNNKYTEVPLQVGQALKYTNDNNHIFTIINPSQVQQDNTNFLKDVLDYKTIENQQRNEFDFNRTFWKHR